MIVVDTSALFAIATQENERDMFVRILDASNSAMCSTVTYVETIMVLTGRSRRLALSRVDEMFDVFLIKLAPVDLALDEDDRAAGRLIDCPVLALWGEAGIPSESGPLATWREWAKDVRGVAIDSGHFPCEEDPEPTAKALVEFFAGPP